MKTAFHILIMFVLTLLALALTSCIKDLVEPMPEPVRVLLVYVGTDSNLAGLEQAKIEGLREGWTGNPNDRIIVYRDTRGADARLMEISNLAPGGPPRQIATYGTENSASAEVFSRVIADVIDMYPNADSYGLLVFSHASGWLPQGVYNVFASGKIPDLALSYSGNTPHSRSVIINGGYGHDESTYGYSGLTGSSPHSRSVIIDGNEEMELKDFAGAIPDGVFDYIVFEACFMAGIEVAYELRNKAPLILASSAEIVDPGFAPVYSSATARLMGVNLEGFGQRVFKHTLTYADNSPQRSATYSVIRTAALDALAAFIGQNCDLSRELTAAELAGIQRFDRLTNATLFFDFEDYYARLLNTNGTGFTDGKDGNKSVPDDKDGKSNKGATNDEAGTSGESETGATNDAGNKDDTDSKGDTSGTNSTAATDGKSEARVAALRAELSRLVADCVTWKAATEGFMNQTAGYNGFEIAKHSGLTTYIPQARFTGLNAAYGELAWVKAIR